MRKVILLLIGIILFMNGITAQAIITDVSVLPENPTDIDLISIFVSGAEGSGGVTITDAVFDLDNYEITLDISLDVGNILVATLWDYTYDVGLLSAGIYDLTVNSIVAVDPIQNSTFITSFEVVPEPATLLLFGLGMCLLRRKKD